MNSATFRSSSIIRMRTFGRLRTNHNTATMRSWLEMGKHWTGPEHSAQSSVSASLRMEPEAAIYAPPPLCVPLAMPRVRARYARANHGYARRPLCAGVNAGGQGRDERTPLG